VEKTRLFLISFANLNESTVLIPVELACIILICLRPDNPDNGGYYSAQFCHQGYSDVMQRIKASRL
jgi:hypothetical protein